MIVATGIDLVDLARIARVLDAHRGRFLARVFTAAEAEYCQALQRPIPSLAARFAAKEAVMKCLGTGWGQGVTFTQIEVRRDDAGAPSVALGGRAAAIAHARGIARIHLSLSHTDTVAMAMAVAET